MKHIATSNNCLAAEVKCFKCKKIGHFSRVCKQEATVFKGIVNMLHENVYGVRKYQQESDSKDEVKVLVVCDVSCEINTVVMCDASGEINTGIPAIVTPYHLPKRMVEEGEKKLEFWQILVHHIL